MIKKYDRKGRKSPYGVKWGVDGKRHFKFFENKNRRDDYFDEMVRKEKKAGRSILEISSHEAVIMRRCIDMVGDPEKVLEACKIYNNQIELKECTVKKAAEEFLEEKTQINRNDDYLRHLRKVLDRFRKKFPKNLSDLNFELARAWVLELSGVYQPVTVRTHIKYSTTFCNWCIKRNYLKENVFEKIECPEVIMPEPGFLSVKDLTKLFETAKERYPKTVANFALAAFAGLRSSAIQRLDISALDFKKRGILIRADQAKNKRRIYLDGFEDNLWEWLEWARKHCPEGFELKKQRWDKLKAKVAKIAEVTIPHNGLRHSFCTYHVALHGDAGKTATLLTHRGNVAILYEHYKGNASKTDGEKYFKIKP